MHYLINQTSDCLPSENLCHQLLNTPNLSVVPLRDIIRCNIDKQGPNHVKTLPTDVFGTVSQVEYEVLAG